MCYWQSQWKDLSQGSGPYNLYVFVLFCPLLSFRHFICFMSGYVGMSDPNMSTTTNGDIRYLLSVSAVFAVLQCCTNFNFVCEEISTPRLQDSKITHQYLLTSHRRRQAVEVVSCNGYPVAC